jgi:hypothetical protein
MRRPRESTLVTASGDGGSVKIVRLLSRARVRSNKDRMAIRSDIGSALDVVAVVGEPKGGLGRMLPDPVGRGELR